MKLKAFILLLMVFTLFSCKGEEPKEKVEAKSIIPKNKYALLIVESKSCIYCAQLKKDLKTESILKESLKGMDLFMLTYENYTPVKTNIGGKIKEVPEKELARELRATSFPNLIFYDKDGNLILQIPGYLPPKELSCVINYVKKEVFKKEELKDYMKKCA
ncbi:thioredoxin fold domain-containing protein [Aquifex pyrophilus]